MKVIASSESNYYEVTDANEFDISIGEIADSIVDKNEVYVRPCENQQKYEDGGTSEEYGREYGAQNTYKDIIDGLCETFPERDIYFFSYDWRKDNGESSELLNEAINSILNEHENNEKVDLVCHSMGGLVTSSYYSKYSNDSKVDKIITCGTPYEGAPKLITSVLSNKILDDNVSNYGLQILGGLYEFVKSSFIGVAELTPTYNYVDEIPMWQDSWKPFNKGDYELSYDDYYSVCSDIFDDYDAACDFQNSLHCDNTQDGYNILLDYNNSYYVIGTNNTTISSVKFQFTSGIDETFNETDLDYDTLGDGTVPYLSSSIMEQIENLDLGRWETFDTSHNGTVCNGSMDKAERDGCLGWIADILEDGKSSIDGDAPEPKPYTVIRIACPVDVTVTKDGETLFYDSIQNKMCSEASYGRLDLLGKNDDIKMLCIDSDDDYEIKMNGVGKGTMDYSIRFYDEKNKLYDERMFENVPITKNTLIYTGTDENQASILKIDEDSDGDIDKIWTADDGEWITTSDNKRVELQSILFKEKQKELEIGEMEKLKVVKNPKKTTDKIAVSYVSSNEDVVSVDQNGKIKAMSLGKATITAITNNNLKASIEITVVEHKHVIKKPICNGKHKIDSNIIVPITHLCGKINYIENEEINWHKYKDINSINSD